jgi:hypothetical protein
MIALVTIVVLVVLSSGPLAAVEADRTITPAAADSAAADSSEVVFRRLLETLRARTDSTLTPEVTRVDEVFHDSVRARFDSTVAASGVPREHYGFGEVARGRARTRTRFSFDPEDTSVRYSKVDGAALLLPTRVVVMSEAWSLSTVGRGGYAFGSGRIRYDAEARLATRWGSTGLQARKLSERFGWTSVHGAHITSLAGVDEQQYLERQGWSAFYTKPLVARIGLTLDYRAERHRSQRAREVFTLGESTALFETNRAATPGELRAVRLALGRPRRDINDVWGSFSAERAGGSLGGELRFDRIAASLDWRPLLPARGEVHLHTRFQAAASKEILPSQALADVGGRSSVRGYPQLSLAGSHALLARIDYYLGFDAFRRAGVPILKDQHLQFVPFVDVGAAWTPSGTSLATGSLPDRSVWKWGAGIGLRKGVGFGEILSHLRVDAAWRLDRRERAPVFYFVLEGEPFQ